MKHIFIILGVIFAIVVIESSAVTNIRKYYLNEVQVEVSEDGEIFCEEVIPLLKNHKFVTYLMGSHVEGKGNNGYLKMDDSSKLFECSSFRGNITRRLGILLYNPATT